MEGKEGSKGGDGEGKGEEEEEGWEDGGEGGEGGDEGGGGVAQLVAAVAETLPLRTTHLLVLSFIKMGQSQNRLQNANGAKDFYLLQLNSHTQTQQSFRI